MHTIAVNACTSGFMQENLLRKRIGEISNARNNRTVHVLTDEEFRLMPDLTFNCNGTLKGFLLGAEVRPIHQNRNRYPEFQVWRKQANESYSRQARGYIRLAAGDFSPDGVLQYNLTTPIQLQSGDVLGVYQPSEGDSVASLFYVKNSNVHVTPWTDDEDEIVSLNSSGQLNLQALRNVSVGYILIFPLTGMSMHFYIIMLLICAVSYIMYIYRPRILY